MSIETTTQNGNAPPVPSPAPSFFTTSNERLSLPFPVRQTLAVFISGVAGFGLGATHGGSMAGLRFRAENAHRLPTSQVGWYLYHKSKNYHAMLGGIKEGMKMGIKLGFWTGAFLYMEEAVDRLRGAVLRSWVGFRDRRAGDLGEKELGLEKLKSGPEIWVQRDFISTTVAALGTAGAFSAWNRMPINTAARTATLGLKTGLAYGLLQDMLSLLKGRRLGYVEFVRRNVFGKGREESNNDLRAAA